jgi:hypothetical protein
VRRASGRWLLGASLSALLMLLVLPGFASSLAPGVSSSLNDPSLARTVHTPAPSTPSIAPFAGAPSLAATPTPAGPSRSAPTPDWASSNFFNDVRVTFTLPYQGGLDFPTVPSVTTVPMSSPGIWMNISTVGNVPIVYANVTIWGRMWPVHNYSQPISGFLPNSPTLRPMHINTSRNWTATFFFDNYRYFWPGDRVYFNLSVTALYSTPATVYSAQGATAFPDNCGPGSLNACNYATWIYYVQGPWVSPDFASSVKISTTPDVLSRPAFDPNPFQPLQIQLTAIAPPGQTVGTIPIAQLSYYVAGHGGTVNSGNYSERFYPLNHTTVSLPFAIGPFPNSTVSFNITLWLPWGGNGAIDRLYSPIYTFNWSANGGWWYPNQGLLANLEFTTFPQVLPPSSGTVGAGTPVNLTIHETKQNVTISSAQVSFIFHDGLGTHEGVVPMHAFDANTSFALVPGLPPGASITFYLIAKDVFGNPVFSQNYTYSATPAPNPLYPAGHSLFFFEALDVAGTGLVAGLPFTLSNASWSESGAGTSLGFGAPSVPRGAGYLLLGTGLYQLTITAFGRNYSTTVSVVGPNPTTDVFYVASSAIPESTTSSLPVVPAGAIAGLAGGAIAVVIILPWYVERRRRI